MLDRRDSRPRQDDADSAAPDEHSWRRPGLATALVALAPPPETFARGRDFAAWLGLTPRQHSSGGKERLGRTSRMGQRDLRRLLIIGAMAVVRWAARRGALQILARAHDGQKAQNAGHGCAGQQDGPDRLGADGERRNLPESGRGRVTAAGQEPSVDVGRSTEDYGQTVKKTGSGKPADRAAP